jgi:hypothetical protein
MMKRLLGWFAVVILAAPVAAACKAGGGAPGGQEAPGATQAAPAAEEARPAGTDGSRNPIARIFSREPAFHEVTVPAGTVLRIELQTTVASDASRVEQPVRARLRSPIVVGSVEAVPAGAQLNGVVTNAKRSGRVKGRAEVAFRLTSLEAHGERLPIRTAVVSRQAPATKTQDAVDIGIPAAAGAVTGAIVGGKDDAAKGAAIGGAAGTGYVLATRGKEVRLPEGTPVNVRLTAPVTLRVPVTR